MPRAPFLSIAILLIFSASARAELSPKLYFETELTKSVREFPISGPNVAVFFRGVGEARLKNWKEEYILVRIHAAADPENRDQAERLLAALELRERDGMIHIRGAMPPRSCMIRLETKTDPFAMRGACFRDVEVFLPEQSNTGVFAEGERMLGEKDRLAKEAAESEASARSSTSKDGTWSKGFTFGKVTRTTSTLGVINGKSGLTNHKVEEIDLNTMKRNTYEYQGEARDAKGAPAPLPEVVNGP